MAINRPVQKAVSVAEAHLARVAGEGSARHPYLDALLESSGRHSGRDLADAVHLLCSLHGRYPGLIELALQRCPKGPVQDWLNRASEGFERERLYLVRLTSAVGPLPSTPGAAETESSLVAARHALETLAMSERNGCALGAALYSAGIPRDSILQYEQAVKADGFLLVVHGAVDELTRARAILALANPSRVDLHDGLTTSLSGPLPVSRAPAVRTLGA